MSMPVKYCFLVQAADDPETFAKIHPVMHRNITGGHFSVWPCSHEPRCRELGKEEFHKLMQRFREKPIPSSI